jgi:hypothetical protein
MRATDALDRGGGHVSEHDGRPPLDRDALRSTVEAYRHADPGRLAA